MSIKPVLDDWEIPRIESLHSLEQRNLVELAVPGRVGSLYQDMNAAPTRIEIRGSLYGEEITNEFLQTLRDKYNAGESVTFVADIVTATQVSHVLIESLQFAQNSLTPDQMQYAIIIKESPPPPPPSDLLAGLDSDLLDQAGDFMDSITGALDLIDSLGSVPDISDPTPPLNDALAGLSSATDGLDTTLGPLIDIFGTVDE